MKKIIIGIIVVAVLIIVAMTQNQPEAQSEAITIGAMAPLSGQISVLGERMRNGMELAKSNLIETGLVEDINMIYEDACDTKSSLNAARKLVETDQVDIVASSFCLFGIDAITPYLNQKEVILFNTAANPESVLNQDYTFSTNFTIPRDSQKMAEFATGELEAKTAAIIHLDTSFGESYRNNFTKHFEQAGGSVVLSEARLPDASDFRTELSKVKAQDPDVLVIIHFGSSLGNAIKQARQLGIESIIMGDYESEDPTVIEFAQGAAEGMIISSSQPEVKTANVKAFEQKYFERFGEMPDVLAANAYDSLRLQVESYVACNQDIECTKEKLESVTNYDGVSGRITIDPETHAVEKPNIFKVVKDGEFVELK